MDTAGPFMKGSIRTRVIRFDSWYNVLNVQPITRICMKKNFTDDRYQYSSRGAQRQILNKEGFYDPDVFSDPFCASMSRR